MSESSESWSAQRQRFSQGLPAALPPCSEVRDEGSSPSSCAVADGGLHSDGPLALGVGDILESLGNSGSSGKSNITLDPDADDPADPAPLPEPPELLPELLPRHSELVSDYSATAASSHRPSQHCRNHCHCFGSSHQPAAQPGSAPSSPAITLSMIHTAPQSPTIPLLRGIGTIGDSLEDHQAPVCTDTGFFFFMFL